MKERRNSGATHSFRLTPQAAALVDAIRHPRRMGGKSRKVSDAIEWYFSARGEHPSYDDLLRNISGLQAQLRLAHEESGKEASPPRGWKRFFTAVW